MIIALCAFMTGSILIATLPVHQIYWAQIFVTTLVTPFGMDMSFPAATLVVSDSVEKSKQGVAASLVNTIVSGFTVFMIILQPSQQSPLNKNSPSPLTKPPLPPPTSPQKHNPIANNQFLSQVNYSISLGLGFAGTVEVHVNRGGRTPPDLLHGYRCALYLAIGLAGLGILLAIFFLLKTLRDERRRMRRSSSARLQQGWGAGEEGAAKERGEDGSVGIKG